jgi:hypothetical protein
MDKRAENKLVRSAGENGGQDDQKDIHPRTGRDETKGKTKERMERGRRKRSSSAWSEKMEIFLYLWFLASSIYFIQ